MNKQIKNIGKKVKTTPLLVGAGVLGVVAVAAYVLGRPRGGNAGGSTSPFEFFNLTPTDAPFSVHNALTWALGGPLVEYGQAKPTNPLMGYGQGPASGNFGSSYQPTLPAPYPSTGTNTAPSSGFTTAGSSGGGSSSFGSSYKPGLNTPGYTTQPVYPALP